MWRSVIRAQRGWRTPTAKAATAAGRTGSPSTSPTPRSHRWSTPTWPFEVCGCTRSGARIFGGVNDALSVRCDLAAMRLDLVAMFSEARERGITVLTFTMVDPSKINPLGRQFRSRVFALNDMIREIAAWFGVLVVDFESYPIAEDRRLWFDDRLHGNALGHQLMAAALAWRLGLDGFDESWADTLPSEPTRARVREQITGDIDWAVRYFAPWVGKGLRRVPHGFGVERKRPLPTVMPKRASSRPE